MGPSCPLMVGIPPVGEGVLAPLEILIAPALTARWPMGAPPFAMGIGIGLDVVCEICGRLEAPRSGVVSTGSGGLSITVTSPGSACCWETARRACLALRTDSLDLRGGGRLSPALLLVPLPPWTFNKALSCWAFPSSESSCSHSSSGSSTSASRSAAARQFGQMNIG